MNTNIKTVRENSGKLQKECAEFLGISLRAWQGYEQGIREPKFEILCKIADLFNVTTDYLLGREISEKAETQTVDELACEFNMTALEKKILDKYISLPQNMRTDLMEFLHKSVQEVMEESN